MHGYINQISTRMDVTPVLALTVLFVMSCDAVEDELVELLTCHRPVPRHCNLAILSARYAWHETSI